MLRHHPQLQRRRNDLTALIAHLKEERLLFSFNHVFSGLTGARTDADFAVFEEMFPAFETLNGQMPAYANELLWPMDVNDPDHCRLLRHINLPSQWTARAGSGFDTFLIEGYQYPGINHNLDQATRCGSYPWKELAWDQRRPR